MNYALAKKLKVVGFPQNGTGSQIQNHTDGGNIVYIPTLSELIEACGENFALLTARRGEKLEALASEYKFSGNWISVSIDNMFGEGSTPEEAVANLYLVLKGV